MQLFFCMRKHIAISLGKLVQAVARTLHRGGGSLPGVFVLRLDKHFLRRLSYPKTVILITATNGKSTITNLLSKVLEQSGQVVISNLEGNNMKAGIVSVLLRHMSWWGRYACDALVLEVDELSLPRLLEDITPSHIMVGNLFRDQLDRVGEMETVIRKFEACLEEYPNALLLNGNDPNVCRLALHTQAKVTYFGVDRYQGSTSDSVEAREGKHCPICKNELEYEYYQYSHIGKFHCLHDSFGSHTIDHLARIEDENFGFAVDGVSYRSPYANIFATYNEVEVVSMARMLGLDQGVVAKTIAGFQMNQGRMERFVLSNGMPCVLNLSKNPTGVNESLKDMVRGVVDGVAATNCLFVLVLNDKEADGEDVSWIYDARFELLNQPHVVQVVTSGRRGLDMALRLSYADLSCPVVAVELADLMGMVLAHSLPVFVIANYTALQPVRAAIGAVSV